MLFSSLPTQIGVQKNQRTKKKMSDTSKGDNISSSLSNLNIDQESLSSRMGNDEEISSSDDQISESCVENLPYNIPKSMSICENNRNLFNENDAHNLQIPIVGYEIMEERARFTVYKLKVESKASGGFWYVFRRYTDFVRLCSKIKRSYPHVAQHLPRKRWLKNNFDPIFLEERVSGLQTLVNAVLNIPELLEMEEIQNFFCLNEPPQHSDTNEESRVIVETLEETIHDLRQQIQDKDMAINALQDNLHSTIIENEQLKNIIRNSTLKCQKCQKDYENLTKLIK